MKKVLIGLLLLAAASAQAQHRSFHYYNHYHSRGPDPFMWVFPTIVGGVVGYEIARQQQQVVIQQSTPIVVQNQTCTPWTEVQNADGTITRTRTCTN